MKLTIITIIIFPILINFIYPTNITIPNKKLSYLTIPGLILNEPIVQAKDNEYYLNHDVNNRPNTIGSVFMDYRNNIEDKIIIIYGHNSKKYITPFNNLTKYLDKNTFKKNNNIIFNTRKYKIFSVILINNDYFYTNINPSNYKEHLKKIKKLSIHPTNTKTNTLDNIIILQTCSYLPNTKYLLVVGKEIA